MKRALAKVVPSQALHRQTEKLFYFVEIANLGSMQAAARKLGVTAPSLSQAMKVLEEAMGADLFHRTRRGVSLTEPGERLLEFCARFYRELDDIQHGIRRPSETTTHRIRVGTFQSIALYFWPKVLDALAGDARVSLSIKTARSSVILERLIQRELDMALTVDSVRHAHLVRRELYRDRYGFYIASRPPQGQKMLRRRDVAAQAVLYIPDAVDESGRTLQQHLRCSDLAFRDEMELDAFEVIGELTRLGHGVGILPTKVASIFGHALEPVHIEGTPEPYFGPHRFFLSYRDDLDLPQSAVDLVVAACHRAVETMHL